MRVSGAKSIIWYAQEFEDLTLQRRELSFEGLHYATSMAEQVPLSVAEQAQHLLGGRVGAATGEVLNLL